MQKYCLDVENGDGGGGGGGGEVVVVVVVVGGGGGGWGGGGGGGVLGVWMHTYWLKEHHPQPTSEATGSVALSGTFHTGIH